MPSEKDEHETYVDALLQLLLDTHGMRKNVRPSLEKFKREAGPQSEKALEYMVAKGLVDKDTYEPTGEGDGIINQIYRHFFEHAGERERTMPDGVKVLWDALCDCYLMVPEEPALDKVKKDIS